MLENQNKVYCTYQKINVPARAKRKMIITGEKIQEKNKTNPPPIVKRKEIKKTRISPILTNIPKNREIQLKENADKYFLKLKPRPYPQ